MTDGKVLYAINYEIKPIKLIIIVKDTVSHNPSPSNSMSRIRPQPSPGHLLSSPGVEGMHTFAFAKVDEFWSSLSNTRVQFIFCLRG